MYLFLHCKYRTKGYGRSLGIQKVFRQKENHVLNFCKIKNSKKKKTKIDLEKNYFSVNSKSKEYQMI